MGVLGSVRAARQAAGRGRKRRPHRAFATARRCTSAATWPPAAQRQGARLALRLGRSGAGRPESGTLLHGPHHPRRLQLDVASASGASPHAATLRLQQNEARNLLASQIGDRAFTELRAALSATTSKGYLSTLFGRVAQVKKGMTSAGSGTATLSVALRSASSGSTDAHGRHRRRGERYPRAVVGPLDPGERQQFARRRRHQAGRRRRPPGERAQHRRRGRELRERGRRRPGLRRQHAGKRPLDPGRRRDAASQRSGHAGRRGGAGARRPHGRRSVKRRAPPPRRRSSKAARPGPAATGRLHRGPSRRRRPRHARNGHRSRRPGVIWPVELHTGLSSAAAQLGELATGAAQLSSGSSQLASSLTAYGAAVSQSRSGAVSVAGGASTLARGASSLRAGVGATSAGAGELAGNARKLASGAGGVAAGAARRTPAAPHS